jgi:hypothetical protein
MHVLTVNTDAQLCQSVVRGSGRLTVSIVSRCCWSVAWARQRFDDIIRNGVVTPDLTRGKT